MFKKINSVKTKVDNTFDALSTNTYFLVAHLPLRICMESPCPPRVPPPLQWNLLMVDNLYHHHHHRCFLTKISVQVK